MFQSNEPNAPTVPGIKYASDSRYLPNPGAVIHEKNLPSLELAFADLQEGDILFINRFEYPEIESDGKTLSASDPIRGGYYIINQTAEITQRNVQIIGMGGTIIPSPDTLPSPLIRIRNAYIPTSTGYNNRRAYIENVILRDLVLDNITTGGRDRNKGTHNEGWYPDISGIEIQDLNGGFLDKDGNRVGALEDPSGKRIPGDVTNVRLENVRLHNFNRGVRIIRAYDIILDNLTVGNCHVGVRIEADNDATGQIRFFGGRMVGNNYHISIDSSPETLERTDQSWGQIQLFGVSMGHSRNNEVDERGIELRDRFNNPIPVRSEGIFIGQWLAGIFVYGCHFEDLSHVLIVGDQVPQCDENPMAITFVGNSIFNIRDAVFDTNQTQAYVGSLVSVGNQMGTDKFDFYQSDRHPAQIYNVPRISQGMLIAGNTQAPSPAPVNLPLTGLYEHLPIAPNPKPRTDNSSGDIPLETQNCNNAYRVSVFKGVENRIDHRPNPNLMPEGTLIFNSTTNKLNVVGRYFDGAHRWLEADGKLAVR
ncbi:MAG: hypothetical protein IPM61_16075 [Chlorobi bacterium]|nr:MAG: hypothetical protein UZ07_CHB004001079 [Chlorobi bacterium OLB7]MBK8912825.1 hypothetical protein [Chlorobiota bacterium]MBX7217566.1 hypothetical protein [Candidatus Kapabacteria bacterium]